MVTPRFAWDPSSRCLATRRRYQPTVEPLEDRCLLAAGILDRSVHNGLTFFGSASDTATANAVAIQPVDGRIVAAGVFRVAGTSSTPTMAIARFNTDGTLDPTFAGTGKQTIDFPGGAQATGVAVQSDGKIVVAGFGNPSSTGANKFVLARLNPDGTLDGTFGSGGKQTIDFGSDDHATALTLEGGGKEVVVAGFANRTGASAFLVARLNADGTLDGTFGTGGKCEISLGGDDAANAVALQSDDKVILAGRTSTGGGRGASNFAVVRLNADGTNDATFGSGGAQTVDFGGDDVANAVALQPDNRLVVAGNTTVGPVSGQNVSVMPSTVTAGAVVRLGTDGRLDPTFGSPFGFQGTPGQVVLSTVMPSTPFLGIPTLVAVTVSGLAVRSDGRIMLAGSQEQQFVLGWLNADGTFLGPSPWPLPLVRGHVSLDDPTFQLGGLESVAGSNGSGAANAVAVDRFGRAVGVGSASNPTGTPQQFALARAITSAPSTPGVFDPSTGTWYLRENTSSGAPDIPPFQYGAPGWIPVVGDWNGDGIDTVGVVDPTTMTWYLRNSNSPGAPDIPPFQYGAPGWIPVVGDWNGSGKTGIGVFDPTTATWYLTEFLGAGAPNFQFVYGGPGWKPVVGDWTGSGLTGLGVIEPGRGLWYLKNNATVPSGPSINPFAYGLSSWASVVGDWDGDGSDTIGVYDPSGRGSWLLRNHNSPGAPEITPFAYGGTNWVQLAGHFRLPPLALRAAGGTVSPAPGMAALRTGELNGIVQAALGRLADAGVSPAVLAHLASVTAVIRLLPDGLLGEALPEANEIVLDQNGAGYGWFVDPTPSQDQEYAAGQALVGTAAAGRMDLLTTVLHELGHLAGRADDDGSALMADSLAPGVRRTAGLDAVFAASTQ